MNKRTSEFVFIAFYAALGVVLNYCTEFLPNMVNGGTLELTVIAIFIASYHLGWKDGIITGILCWVVGMFFGLSNYIVTPMQTLLDYVVPVVGVGLASAFPPLHLGKLKISNIYVGSFFGMFIKFASHVLAGVYYWFPEGDAAGSLTSWIFSLQYNIGYNMITLICVLIVVPILLSILQKSSRKEFIGIKE